jgi:hypothetical protein
MKRSKRRRDWTVDVQVPLYCVCRLRLGVGDVEAFRSEFFPNRGKSRFNYASVFQEGGRIGMVFDRTALRPGVIAHEIAHVAERISRHSGWWLSNETTEPFAYLQQWLHEFVRSQLKKHGERMLPDEL